MTGNRFDGDCPRIRDCFDLRFDVVGQVKLITGAIDKERLRLDRTQRSVKISVEAWSVPYPAAAPRHRPVVEVARVLNVDVVLAPGVAPFGVGLGLVYVL